MQNQTDVDTVNVSLRTIANALKSIELKRQSFTQPLNQSLKEINGTFKELTIPLNTAKSILTKKVMDWRAIEMEKIRKEQERIAKEEERRRKIQEAHKEQGHEVSKPVVMEKPVSLKQTDTTNTRSVWAFEIEKMDKVPRMFLSVNETAIRQAIRDGVREIEGVRIFQKESMVIR